MHISGLRKNLQHLVIGQEVEAWEGGSLGTQVLLEALLNFVEPLVVVDEFLEVDTDFVVGGEVKGSWLLLGASHVLLPLLVDHLEHLGLGWKLLDDVLSVENVFQVHPLALELEPLVDKIGQVDEFALHGLDTALDLSDELGAHHG